MPLSKTFRAVVPERRRLALDGRRRTSSGHSREREITGESPSARVCQRTWAGPDACSIGWCGFSAEGSAMLVRILATTCWIATVGSVFVAAGCDDDDDDNVVVVPPGEEPP